MADAGAASIDSPMLLKARLYDHAGMEMAAIGEREADRAIGLVRRADPEGKAYEPVTGFFTIEQLRRLALQVVAGNPKAISHEQTPAALALGLLAILAAVQHGTSLAPAGGGDVQAASSSH
ncbi:hypothetical protein [Bosea sp. (in: a-proteobacteria)]|uniref:hypothetical protein n=1 Tax=Bosea sp. (in: a-proteobacteria) TaxID=1871050 RepID=UPI0026228FAE|nr:hypothetical protein [Bosea sp. (in: a-proteobacteria)]MCO5091971.1 hypothetical protein [Bosea sp. (in: a-proteobacteria)]